jgi:uncharacterized protein
LGWERFDRSIYESLALTKWYAQEHVLLCLIPAFFIAGAIAVFVSQNAVMKYLGPTAPKPLAYGVASVSGTILAVCSCTILPLFAGIWRMGAGLGPATAFLYSGPAINVLAIVLTAAVLGPSLGIARAVGAIAFSIVIGSGDASDLPQGGDQEGGRGDGDAGRRGSSPAVEDGDVLRRDGRDSGVRQLGPAGGHRGHLVCDLVQQVDHHLAVRRRTGVILVAWFGIRWWKMALVGLATAATWALVTRDGCCPGSAICLPGYEHGLPYGAMIPFAAATWASRSCWASAAGAKRPTSGSRRVGGLPSRSRRCCSSACWWPVFLLGRPGEEGMIPSQWVASLVGGNSLGGQPVRIGDRTVMYFATLTEVPILQGLIGNGMGQGPALALLLAGPALSLPNMLVIRSVLGTQKTLVFISLVVVMSTLTGWAYGAFFSAQSSIVRHMAK